MVEGGYRRVASPACPCCSDCSAYSASASRCRPRAWPSRGSTPSSSASAAPPSRRCPPRVLLALWRERLPDRATLVRLALVALGVVFGFPLLSALALRELTSAHSAVIVGLLPAATAVMAVARAGERPSGGFWVASAAGLAAVLGVRRVPGRRGQRGRPAGARRGRARGDRLRRGRHAGPRHGRQPGDLLGAGAVAAADAADRRGRRPRPAGSMGQPTPGWASPTWR